MTLLPVDSPTGPRRKQDKKRPAKSAPSLPFDTVMTRARSPPIETVGSPTEELAKLHRDQNQPRRLAEYQADSLPEVRPEVIEEQEKQQTPQHGSPEKSDTHYEFKSPLKQVSCHQICT